MSIVLAIYWFHALSLIFQVWVQDLRMQIYTENPAIVEIGFTLAREEQGKGYAQEAVQALVCSIFELGYINQIVGITEYAK